MLEEKETRARVQRIEELVRQIESTADPATRAGAVELVQTLMDLHGAGIERMLEITFQSGDQGQTIIDEFGNDKLVGSLLLLYGLHPLGLDERVRQALDKVRPYLKSHGGNVDLLGIQDGAVHLQLQGSCDGCPSSAMTLKLAIEEAVYDAAPDIMELRVEGVVEEQPRPSNLVPLQRLPRDNGAKANGNGEGWKEVSDLSSLAQGSVRALEVDGRTVLFCRVDETFYAYHSQCPGCGNALQSAGFEAGNLICPGCRQRYDVARAGRGLDQPELQLEPFPLLMEQGRARIALPA